jgi:hypothetical protein
MHISPKPSACAIDAHRNCHLVNRYNMQVCRRVPCIRDAVLDSQEKYIPKLKPSNESNLNIHQSKIGARGRNSETLPKINPKIRKIERQCTHEKRHHTMMESFIFPATGQSNLSAEVVMSPHAFLPLPLP